MKEKTVKSLSDIIADILYNYCCKDKECKNCKFKGLNYDCYICDVVKIIENYEKENDL